MTPATAPATDNDRAAQHQRALDEQLRQRDQLLHAMFDSLGAHVVVLDATGRITYASRSWMRFGAENDADMRRIAVGANYLDECRRASTDEPEARAALDGIEAVLQRRLPRATLEYPCHAPHQRRWFILHVDPMPADHGGVVITHTDVTDRKLAEERLRQSEHRYRAVVDSQTELVCRYLPDTTLTFVNEAYCRYFGKTRRELIGTRFLELVPPYQREGALAHVRDAMAHPGATPLAEQEVVRPDGRLCWQQWADHAIVGPDGRVIELQGVGRDVTERKHAEHALRESETRLKLAAEAAELGTYDLDVRSGRVTWSQGKQRIFGVTDDTYPRTFEHYLALIHPDDRAMVARELGRSLATCGLYDIEFRIIRGDDGAVRWLTGRGHTIAGADGRAERATGVVMDVTERRRAETAIRESEAKFRGVFESDVVAACLWQADGTITDANDAWLALHGLSRGALERGEVNFLRITPPEHYASDQAALTKLLSAGTCEPFEKELLTGDGRRIPVLIAAALLPGCRDRGAAFVIDLSDRKRAERQIVDAQRRYQIATAGGRVAVWDYNVATGESFSDPILMQMLGLGEQVTMRHDQWVAHLHPDDRDRVLAHNAAARADDAPRDQHGNTPMPPLEYRLIRADGREMWVLDRGTVFRRADGHPYRLAGTITDNTERKRMEAALAGSERELRIMFDLAATGTVLASLPDARYLRVNEKFGQITGYKASELIGMSAFDLTHPDDRPSVRRRFARVVAGEVEQWTTEKRYLRRDGQTVWVQINGRLIRDADGRPWRTISNVLDISERKQAERAMHDRLRFEVLLSEMATAFVHVTPDDLDRVTGEWLQRLVEHMDVERATLWQSPRRGEALRITHTWAVGELPVFPATFAESDFPWTMARLHEGATVVRSRFEDLPPEAAAEVPIYRAHGSRSCVVTPLMEGDELIGVLSFGCVTAERIWPPEFLPRLRLVAGILAGALVRRRIEHETRRKLDELAHAWRVASLGELATTLAHELNQPLTAAVANAQAARRLLSSGHTPRDADVVEAINDLEQDATRAADLIRRMRQWLQRGERRSEMLDVSDAVADIRSLVRGEALAAGVELCYQLPTDLPRVPADRLQLQQVVLNLVRNAIEASKSAASPDARTVIIRTDVSGDEPDAVVIEVSDAGAPLSAEEMVRMFDPFYTTKPDGLGVGLSISRSIVESHGGRLWSTANPDGRGLAVHVSLPGGAGANANGGVAVSTTGVGRKGANHAFT